MEGLIVFFSIVALLIYVAISYNKRRAAEKAHLYEVYQKALKSGNKGDALTAGRAYYGFTRKDGALTIYDEQAITNDLSTMN